MPFQPKRGAYIAGRYELVRSLGEGGMGEVWAAQHTGTRKSVALKFLKNSARPEERRRFLREARAASAVHHPAVVPIHDILEEDGTPILVMDLLDGETLATRLARHHALALNEVAQLLAPVISAVGTAHALGIVHRDLKPENIFVTELTDGRVDVKVLDFGVAKLTAVDGDAAQTAGLTRTGEILGTPYYMSPEQVFGEHDVDHRADIWSLGVILYECLAGRRPFEGDNVGQILKKVMMGGLVPLEKVAPHVPVAVTALVNRMISVERDARPQDLREVLEILGRHTDETVVMFGTAQPIKRVIVADAAQTDPFSMTTASGPPQRRPASAPLGLVLAAGLAAAATFAVVWFVLHRNPPPVVATPTPTPLPAPTPAPAPPPPTPVATPTPTPTPPTPAPPRPAGDKKRPHAHPSSDDNGKKKPNKLPGGVVDQVPF